jgi:hypothetical protein
MGEPCHVFDKRLKLLTSHGYHSWQYDRSFFFFSSDHGYHTGQWTVPVVKKGT